MFDFWDGTAPFFERERSYELDFRIDDSRVDGSRLRCYLVVPADLDRAEANLPMEASNCAFTLRRTGEPGGILLRDKPTRVAVRISSHGVPLAEGVAVPRYQHRYKGPFETKSCLYLDQVELTAYTGENEL